jgi:hypothetical protein
MSTAKASTPKSKVIVLALPPDQLAKFPHDPSSKSSEASKPASSSPGTPAQIVEPTPADAPSDAAAPASDTNNGLLAPPAAAGSKRKGVPGPKPGAKRGAGAVEGGPKPRGKPGPKKKQRM